MLNDPIRPHRPSSRFPVLTRSDTQQTVFLILDAMAEALARGDRTEIRNRGRFSVNHQHASGAILQQVRQFRCQQKVLRISNLGRNCASESYANTHVSRS